MSETYLRSANKDIQNRIDALAKIVTEGGDEERIAREKKAILNKIKEFPGRYELESNPGVEERLMREFRKKLMTEEEWEEEKEYKTNLFWSAHSFLL